MKVARKLDLDACFVSAKRTREPRSLVPEATVLGGELDGDGGEVHHLQHLLGLSVNLNDILKQREHE